MFIFACNVTGDAAEPGVAAAQLVVSVGRTPHLRCWGVRPASRSHSAPSTSSSAALPVRGRTFASDGVQHSHVPAETGQRCARPSAARLVESSGSACCAGEEWMDTGDGAFLRCGVRLLGERRAVAAASSILEGYARNANSARALDAPKRMSLANGPNRGGEGGAGRASLLCPPRATALL